MAKKATPKLDTTATQIIYCGDNLDQLRKLADGCIDLVYIDPPFNSNRNYEVFWGEAKEKRAFDDRHESTRAYIEFMRPRCVELARVLKNTGSFYYHCDWHAGHYVKVMLDQIFGESSFINEIIWHYRSFHGNVKRYFARKHDTLFFYSKSQDWTFNRLFDKDNEDTIDFKRWGDYIIDGYKILGSNMPIQDSRFMRFHRRWVRENGRQPRPDDVVYEVKGQALDTVWDIKPVDPKALDRLGYPTQKPLALLDRIIKSSSNPGDLVLDAFCGCGTALVAAENLGRKWIGIDVSPTACRVMAKRLEKDCLLREGKDFTVRDLPREESQLRKMPHFEFENWAVIAIGGIPNKAKVGDMGIDGRIYPVSAVPKGGKKKGELDFMDVWYPIQVKQKDKAGRPDIDSFEAVMIREDRTKGFFVSFDFTSDAKTEIGAFFRKTGKVIIPLTVREIIEEELAMKLA